MVRGTLRTASPSLSCPHEEKTTFYHEIGEILSENGGAFIIILGDFNAKLLKNPGLPRNIGNHIFHTRFALETQSAEVLENRDLFLDFLVHHDLVALNTLHESNPGTQVTYHYPGQPRLAPPWDEENFAQLDFILTKTRWKNHFHTVVTDPRLDYDSDHLLVRATLAAKWRFGTTPKKDPPVRHKRRCPEESLNE